MNIESILAEFEKISNWGNAGLTAFFCLAMGYLWRGLKTRWTPNQAIPGIVMLSGAFAFALLSGHKLDAVNDFHWHARAVIIGFIIGFLTVIVHNYGISKIEDYISSRLGFTVKPLPPPPPPKP